MKNYYVENLLFVTHEAIALRAGIVLRLYVLRSAWHSLAIDGEIFNNACLRCPVLHLIDREVFRI